MKKSKAMSSMGAGHFHVHREPEARTRHGSEPWACCLAAPAKDAPRTSDIKKTNKQTNPTAQIPIEFRMAKSSPPKPQTETC